MKNYKSGTNSDTDSGLEDILLGKRIPRSIILIPCKQPCSRVVTKNIPNTTLWMQHLAIEASEAFWVRLFEDTMKSAVHTHKKITITICSAGRTQPLSISALVLVRL